MLNELPNTGHSRRNLHLCIAYSDILPCHLTLPLLYLRIPHRLDKLHSDMPCATLSIKLIPFPISSSYPWQSILCYALRLLYLYPKHSLCCFNVALRTILISYLTRTPCSHSYPTITAIHSLSQTYPSHSHTHSHPSVFLSYSEKRLI